MNAIQYVPVVGQIHSFWQGTKLRSAINGSSGERKVELLRMEQARQIRSVYRDFITAAALVGICALGVIKAPFVCAACALLHCLLGVYQIMKLDLTDQKILFVRSGVKGVKV